MLLILAPYFVEANTEIDIESNDNIKKYCQEIIIRSKINFIIKSKNGWLRILKNGLIYEYTGVRLSNKDINNIEYCIRTFEPDIYLELNRGGI